MADAAQALEKLRRTSYARSAWSDAHASLTQADELAGLGAADLELLATAPYMLGRDDDTTPSSSAPITPTSTTGGPLRAARCAFWVAHQPPPAGDTGPAMVGWAAPSASSTATWPTTASSAATCCCPVMFRHEAEGDSRRRPRPPARPRLGRAVRRARPDALALARRRGTLVMLGRVAKGLALLDEAMVAVPAGELLADRHRPRLLRRDPACQAGLRARRAREWTAALSPGASSSPTWSPSPVPAWRIAPRSCSSAVPGLRRSNEARRATLRLGSEGRLEAAVGMAVLPAGRGPPAARRSSPPPSMPTARRATTAASPSPASRCCGSRTGRRHPAAVARDPAARSARPPIRPARCTPAARARRDRARRRRARRGARAARELAGSRTRRGRGMLARAGRVRGRCGRARRR